MRFDASQSTLRLAEIVLDLRLTHAEHPPELFERHLVIQDHPDLIKGETEVAQGQQPVQTAELPRLRTTGTRSPGSTRSGCSRPISS